MTATLFVGLTGGIGSGKSTVSALFADKGIVIVDTDQIARDVVAPGQSALADIQQRFGEAAILPDGSLNRAYVRQQTFATPDLKSWLNALLHPLIRNSMTQQMRQAQSPYCIVDVPLLTENKMQALFDRILVVDCPVELQLARAMQRDGSDEKGIKNIIAAQATREQRLAIADDVVTNDKDKSHIAKQVTELHQYYLSLSKVHQ